MPRCLLAIPHFYDATGKARDGKGHGSVARPPLERVEALTQCLHSLRQLFHTFHCIIDHNQQAAITIDRPDLGTIDIVICTTQGKHLLERLPVESHLFTHQETGADPMFLGYECHAVLRERLGTYDYYCYLEDDLIAHDPWLFQKLAWFTQQAGAEKLLLPNRYEVGPHERVAKAYVDGPLAPAVTAIFQDVAVDPKYEAIVLDRSVAFERTFNPHAGCFFLSAAQMAHWVRQPYFLDRDCRFVGPLESAATLGIMRAFKIYKPALANADFLEIQHFGQNYLNMIKEQSQAASG
jgi:hypothetical protein